MGKRQFVQKEWRLLSWWLATYHPNAEILMNVRVGPTLPVGGVMPTDAIGVSASRLRNRWVDAIYIENGEVTIVEAKIEPDPGIFSQLVHYLRKLRMDPNFSAYTNWRVNLVALVYNDDPSVGIEAPWYGVRWVVYQPNLSNTVPPQLRGGPADMIGSVLPQDWPARISMWTGKPLGSV